jgi:NADH:ubiquinone oxidoreductase subunit 5 (subunit L)/multisubunit Na+/H+ antiporter MnhA subunit
MPAAGVLLVGIVFLTGLYIGRLFFAVFTGPASNQRTPHHPSGLLFWPLVPLAFGSIILGYLEYPSHSLSTLLQPSLSTGQEAVGLVSPLGLLAGALGLAGFGAAYWWRQQAGAGARLPETSLRWVDPTATGGQHLAAQVAAIHSGRLGAYVLTSVVGLALILLLAKAL